MVARSHFLPETVMLGGGGLSRPIAATTPEWQFVERITITGSAVASQDFATVLNGDTDLGYRITLSMIAGSAETLDSVFLRVNGSAIVTDRRYISAAGTSVTTGATGSSVYQLSVQGTGGTAKEGFAEYTLNYSRTGYQRLWRYYASKSNNTTDWQEEFFGSFRMTTPGTATNITSLGIGADTPNDRIGVGAILTLYKKGG